MLSCEHRVKHRLHEMLHSSKDFEEEDFIKVCKNFNIGLGRGGLP